MQLALDKVGVFIIIPFSQPYFSWIPIQIRKHQAEQGERIKTLEQRLAVEGRQSPLPEVSLNENLEAAHEKYESLTQEIEVKGYIFIKMLAFFFLSLFIFVIISVLIL